MPDPIVKGECAFRFGSQCYGDNGYVLAVCVDTPELAGDTIAWLTCEKRDWLAGRYISCNWDMTELLVRRDEIVEKDLLKLKLAV